MCGVGVVLSRVRLDLWRVGGVGTSFHVGVFKPLKNMASVGGLYRPLLAGPLRCRLYRKSQLFPLLGQELFRYRVWPRRIVGLVRLI